VESAQGSGCFRYGRHTWPAVIWVVLTPNTRVQTWLMTAAMASLLAPKRVGRENGNNHPVEEVKTILNPVEP
jgi:hypothetical protein